MRRLFGALVLCGLIFILSFALCGSRRAQVAPSAELKFVRPPQPPEYLAKKFDVIVVSHYDVNHKWLGGLVSLPTNEIHAFTNFTLPALRQCGDCQLYLYTAFGDDVWPPALLAALKELHVVRGTASVMKNLLYKFSVRGEILTVVTDMDDFVEVDYWDKLGAAAKKFDRDRDARVCFFPSRPVNFFAAGEYSPDDRVAPWTASFPPKAYFAMLSRGLYHDPLFLSHVKFRDRNYTRCHENVDLDSSCFVTRRKGSSGNVNRPETNAALLRMSVPFDRRKYKLAKAST